MKNIKYLILSVSVVLCLWLVPYMIRFATGQSSNYTFVLYSGLIHDFIKVEYINDQRCYRDTQQRGYTEEEVDSLLPFFHYRQLLADGRFPETINGKHYGVKKIQRESFMWRTMPSDVNKTPWGLYPLFESQSGRIDLKMPEDVFRFTSKGIEFIDMASNQVDTDKSQLFNKLLSYKEMNYPVRQIVGNPTNRKAYDNGYLIEDAEGKVFQLMMRKGQPLITRIHKEDSIEVQNLFVTEFNARRQIGFMVDTKHRMYQILKNGELVRMEMPCFDPQTESMTIFANPQEWCLRIGRSDGYYYEVLEAYTLRHITDYQQISTQEESWMYRYFPIKIRFVNAYNEKIYPNLEFNN